MLIEELPSLAQSSGLKRRTTEKERKARREGTLNRGREKKTKSETLGKTGQLWAIQWRFTQWVEEKSPNVSEGH